MWPPLLTHPHPSFRSTSKRRAGGGTGRIRKPDTQRSGLCIAYLHGTCLEAKCQRRYFRGDRQKEVAATLICPAISPHFSQSLLPTAMHSNGVPSASTAKVCPDSRPLLLLSKASKGEGQNLSFLHNINIRSRPRPLRNVCAPLLSLFLDTHLLPFISPLFPLPLQAPARLKQTARTPTRKRSFRRGTTGWRGHQAAAAAPRLPPARPTALATVFPPPSQVRPHARPVARPSRSLGRRVSLAAHLQMRRALREVPGHWVSPSPKASLIAATFVTPASLPLQTAGSCRSTLFHRRISCVPVYQPRPPGAGAGVGARLFLLPECQRPPL